jgi:uncharacterized membrane protein YidH (DUF202 family)
MLLALALVGFGWAMASLYIYLEGKYPQHAEKSNLIIASLFSVGAILILVFWFTLGAGMVKISDLWS